MSGWQLNHARRDANTGKALRELASGVLSGLVFILIKDDVDQTIRLLGNRSQDPAEQRCGGPGFFLQ